MDSLPLVKTLQDSGVKPEQAEAIASGTKDFVEDSMSDYATKADLEVFGLRLKTEIIDTVDGKITAAKQELNGRLDKLDNRMFQLFMLVVAMGVSVVGAVYLLLRDAGVT